MYYEIEFENPVDLVRVSREMKQQLFVDEFVNPLQSKYWFAAISEHGLCVLNTCVCEAKDMDAVLANIKAINNPNEQVPEPICASFSQVK